MKTMVMKEVLLNVPGASQNRYSVIRAELVRRLINERTGVSQASDNPADPPHQAQLSAEKISQINTGLQLFNLSKNT